MATEQDIGADRAQGVVRRRSVMRAAAFAVVAAAALYLGGFALFANHIAGLAPPATEATGPADGIIVLTGGHNRIDAGLELLSAGKARRLLITGVNPVATRGQLRQATGAGKTLFDCCVDLDRAALDTAGNARESAKWIRRNGYDRVILVTNDYHIPRSLLEMRRLSGDADIVAWPVVNAAQGGWGPDVATVRVLFTEYAKYVAALARAPVASTPGVRAETAVR